MLSKLSGIAGLLATKILSGAIIFFLSARWLDVEGFAAFSQFGFFVALLNLFTSGGLQSVIIREAAAAGDDWHRAGAVAGSGLALAAGGGLLLLAISSVGAGAISALLTDAEDDALLVILCAAAACVAGAGQVVCAFLTGCGHLHRSLLSQGIAAMVTTVATVAALAQGGYALAVVAFAAGLATIFPIAMLLMPSAVRRRLIENAHVQGKEIAKIVRFALTFLATATLMPIALFFLRDHYRELFGVTVLAYWLAANRISDITTQFIGLYMTQIYVPETARQDREESGGPSRLRRYWVHLGVACGCMTLGAAIFAIAPGLWVGLLLGTAMLPAAAIILMYLGGDVLRCWPSLNANDLIARRRVDLYAVLEVANVVIFAGATVALLATGPLAPAYAYAATNLAVGILGFVIVSRFGRQRAAVGDI